MTVHRPSPSPAEFAGLPVLFVATRDPRGQMTGRKTVLRTIVSSLVSLGCKVTVAHFGAPDPAAKPDPADPVRYIGLPGPRLHELAAAGLTGFLPGRRSLNECFYASTRARASLKELAGSERVKVVVTDMLRTAEYGQALGLPWIADLDDLLSLRYARMAGSGSAIESCQGLLGYHDTAILRALCVVASPFRRLTLRREAAILARREEEVARQADVASAVSPVEAAALAEKTGSPVYATAMAIGGPDVIAPLAERPKELVFLGGFDYMPNRQSAQEFDRETRPALARLGIDDVTLDVIGSVRPEYRATLSESIRLAGYVDDLDTALQTYRAMLVPAGLRGGVKTKIVHAALNGTVILSHPDAVEGTGLEHERDVLLWRTPENLAALLLRLRAGDPTLERIAGRARLWAVENFSAAALRQKWADHLGRVYPVRRRAASR